MKNIRLLLSRVLHPCFGDCIAATLVSSVIFFMFSSCHNDDLWDDLPGDISEFVSTYFPGQGIDAYSSNGDTYHVRISNGPGLTFDKEYKWVAIAGYGMPLPQVLLFDQLPPELYKYLESSQQLNSVFSIERNDVSYTVTLQYSTITYDIATGEIKGGRPSS